jgi:hypothetical protein
MLITLSNHYFLRRKGVILLFGKSLQSAQGKTPLLPRKHFSYYTLKQNKQQGKVNRGKEDHSNKISAK